MNINKYTYKQMQTYTNTYTYTYIYIYTYTYTILPYIVRVASCVVLVILPLLYYCMATRGRSNDNN